MQNNFKFTIQLSKLLDIFKYLNKSRIYQNNNIEKMCNERYKKDIKYLLNMVTDNTINKVTKLNETQNNLSHIKRNHTFTAHRSLMERLTTFLSGGSKNTKKNTNNHKKRKLAY